MSVLTPSVLDEAVAETQHAKIGEEEALAHRRQEIQGKLVKL